MVYNHILTRADYVLAFYSFAGVFHVCIKRLGLFHCENGTDC